MSLLFNSLSKIHQSLFASSFPPLSKASQLCIAVNTQHLHFLFTLATSLPFCGVSIEFQLGFMWSFLWTTMLWGCWKGWWDRYGASTHVLPKTWKLVMKNQLTSVQIHFWFKVQLRCKFSRQFHHRNGTLWLFTNNFTKRQFARQRLNWYWCQLISN
jgi:hypothetical protein